MKILFSEDAILDIWADESQFLESYAALDVALSRGFEVCMSPCSLIELSAVMEKQGGEAGRDSFDMLKSVLAVFSVLDITSSDCDRALASGVGVFRGALVACSAKRNEVDFIVALDTDDYAAASVPVITPREFTALYKPESIVYDLIELPLEAIRRIVEPIADRYGAKKVSLFGSRARGDASSESDFDILLDKGSIRGLRVLDFEEELRKALKRKVDVTTTQGASTRFLEKIREDEVILYEA